MKLKVDLVMTPVETPDAEFRVKSAWRILAEMALAAASRDSEQAPVELPQELVGKPSPPKHTAIIET